MNRSQVIIVSGNPDGDNGAEIFLSAVWNLKENRAVGAIFMFKS